MEGLMFLIIAITSLGLSYQCMVNQRRQRAQFLSFPIALLILFPYPIMGLLGWSSSDTKLLAISTVIGVPNAWLGLQYFQFEWKYRSKNFSFEEKLTISLVLVGVFLLAGITQFSDFATALSAVGAYFTFCIAIFSYLLKIWRVSHGHESIDGLTWSTLITLGIFFSTMTYVVGSSDIKLLAIAYLFSTVSCILSILYKWNTQQNEKRNIGNRNLR